MRIQTEPGNRIRVFPASYNPASAFAFFYGGDGLRIRASARRHGDGSAVPCFDTQAHTHSGVPLGIELVLPDWFYAGVLDAALVLTIDPAYFRLKGGIARWLYRLVHKHYGKQPDSWQFDFRHRYHKSGSAARFSNFAYYLRALVARQSLPGYVLGIERMLVDGQELLTFRPVLHAPAFYHEALIWLPAHNAEAPQSFPK